MSPERDSLRTLAARLREEDSVISPCIAEPGDEVPALGMLAAAGPRASAEPGEYALLFESVREGYLLHYGTPRVVTGADPDLSLLAGDYLYALGLERLAVLGDLAAVHELSDLISLSAQLHVEGRPEAAAAALWLSAAVAVGCGASSEHEAAKADLRAGDAGAGRALASETANSAANAGIDDALALAADAIDFRLDFHP